MKKLKFIFLIMGFILTLHSQAQKSPESLDAPDLLENFRISIGIGTANYYGDLMKNNSILKQTKASSVNLGLIYQLNKRFNIGINLGYQKLQGADYKSGGAHPDRNLDFKSSVFNFNVFGEYIVLPESLISPTFSAGFGVMTFDPYTEDATGKKVMLRELGTEGQGLPGSKGLYSNATWVAPIGLGARLKLHKYVAIAIEGKYHFTGTDYLDDVSTNGYPDKAILDAWNPETSKFTYRGAGAYPKNPSLPRGNPKNKDGFYTIQVKFLFPLI